MRASAILIIGPTGSGKSPLGDHLQQAGLDGNRCFHFDFGSELRRIAHGTVPPPGFDQGEHTFINDLLRRGLLLENEHFPVARKIVEDFFRRHSFDDGDTVVLNGLPRHVDQARDLSSLVDVRGVIVLSCMAEDVMRRIELNSGGDRTGRTDDTRDMIDNKLEIFRTRTAPLVEFYRSSGAVVFECPVTEHTTSAAICRGIPESFCRALTAS